LLLDHREVEIGSRAFDLLAVLLEARGQVVVKSHIIQKVWPFTIVEECNLRFQMGVLRKALGRHRDLIKTIPGRGYMLADDLPEQVPMEMAPTAVETEEPMTGSPSVDEPRRQTGSNQPPSPLQKIELLEKENLRLRRAIAELAAVYDLWPHAQT
jgi:DNA-binding winged helix-turn-helix (wHTH) protein